MKITAYIVWHPRTRREWHELVYDGTDEAFAHTGLRRCVEGGGGSYGYIQRDGVTVAYIGQTAMLRPVA